MIAVLLNPNNPQTTTQVPEIKAAALALGLQLNFSNASTAPEIDKAYLAIVQQRTDALIIGADTFFVSRRDQLAALAARYHSHDLSISRVHRGRRHDELRHRPH